MHLSVFRFFGCEKFPGLWRNELLVSVFSIPDVSKTSNSGVKKNIF